MPFKSSRRVPITPLVYRLMLWLLSLMWFLSTSAFAQPAAAPSGDDLRARLATLDQRNLPEADRRSAQQALEQALASIAAEAEGTRRLAALRQQLDDAPREIRSARHAIEQLKARVSMPPTIADSVKAVQLEQRLATSNTQLVDWKRVLAEANAQLAVIRTVPERAQTEIAANQARMLQIEEALKSGRQGDRVLGAEGRDALAAEWHALDRQTEVRLSELAGVSLMGDLGQVRRELAVLNVARLEADIEALQTALSRRRSQESAQAVAGIAQGAETVAADPGGLLAQAHATNQKLSDYLLQSTEYRNELTQRNLRARQQLDAISQASAVLDQQLQALEGSVLLAKILYEQKSALPALALDASLANRIADTRLYQFEINQQRDRLGDPAAHAEAMLAESPEPVSQATREALQSLLETRAELLDRLNRELNALLGEAITLQLAERQLRDTADKLRATLEERMFWIPSNRQVSLEWLLALPAKMKAQVAAMPWQAVGTELRDGLQARPWLFLPVLMLAGLLLWRRGWLHARLESLGRDIGYVRRDSQWHTPAAVLLNMLLALPLSLLLALAGLALLLDARGQNAVLGAALLQMAQAWLVFHTAYRVLDPGGVAERHFHWTRQHIAALRSLVVQLATVVIAVVAVVMVAEHEPRLLASDALGMVVLCAGYAWMAVLMGRMLSHEPSSGRRTPLRMGVSLLLALMPLALIAAVLAGYYYTALKLTGRLIDSLLLLVLWSLLDAMLVRSLAVAARRIDHQRAVSRREAAEREAEEGPDARPMEAPRLGIEQINQQSLRLLRLTLMGGFALLYYWVWADLLTVFAYLDRVVLYEYVSGTAETLSSVPISLRDALAALAITVIATMLARNLPGLLEIAVLSRMKLAQGSAYAITTLLSYAIMGAGVIVSLSTLGVSWDKLQWLVAALSVGLGFGLQEIFANFISGLIILFERPVRIGDTVTIGSLSGTVSRIQIRATTITDFDRKEIIVPNKTFVTGQLINWSLTDTVTRVTVKLGVAYGSDLEQVRALLFEAAEANPRVLKDPAPLVFFLSFGASTLDHELRVHVRELADRNAAIDEINRYLDRRCRELGIEIAFNQVDVHVRGLEGAETLLHSFQPRPGEV